MDHGQILAQTVQPGLEVPDLNSLDMESWKARLATLSASMLVEGIRKCLFVSPIQDLTLERSSDNSDALRHAPKITSEDGHIDWQTWPAEKIVRYSKVLKMWNFVGDPFLGGRCIWSGEIEALDDFEERSCSQGRHVALRRELLECCPGVGYVSPLGNYMIIGTADRKFVATEAVTIAGFGKDHHPGKAFVRCKVLAPKYAHQVQSNDVPIRINMSLN